MLIYIKIIGKLIKMRNLLTIPSFENSLNTNFHVEFNSLQIRNPLIVLFTRILLLSQIKIVSLNEIMIYHQTIYFEIFNFNVLQLLKKAFIKILSKQFLKFYLHP